MANFTAAQAVALFDAITSAVAALGVFDKVNAHEPPTTPSHGLSCSVTLATLVPDGAKSGLNNVTGRITFMVRMWTAADQRPLDAVDPMLLGALSAVAGALSGGFTLGGTVRNVDLFNMRAQAAYVPHQEKEMRVIDLTVPVVVNDLWAEVP